MLFNNQIADNGNKKLHRPPKRYRKAITFGTFDLFHVGHVRILQRAADVADSLVVGVSTDGLNISKKGRAPVFNFDERTEILRACRYVDEVFPEESLAKKREYILKYGAEVLIMGDDWEGKFDEFKDICDVIYLTRTENISTTITIEGIQGLVV